MPDSEGVARNLSMGIHFPPPFSARPSLQRTTALSTLLYPSKGPLYNLHSFTPPTWPQTLLDRSSMVSIPRPLLILLQPPVFYHLLQDALRQTCRPRSQGPLDSLVYGVRPVAVISCVWRSSPPFRRYSANSFVS